MTPEQRIDALIARAEQDGEQAMAQALDTPGSAFALLERALERALRAAAGERLLREIGERDCEYGPCFCYPERPLPLCQRRERLEMMLRDEDLGT